MNVVVKEVEPAKIYYQPFHYHPNLKLFADGSQYNNFLYSLFDEIPSTD